MMPFQSIERLPSLPALKVKSDGSARTTGGGHADVVQVVLAGRLAALFPHRMHGGSNNPMRIPMMVITTNNSMSVKPG